MANLYSRYKADFSANFKLALPIMAGQLGQISVNIADNIMVGALGTTALAALSLAVSLYIVVYVACLGVAVALQTLVAEADGAEEPKRASQLFKHSLVVNVATAILSIGLIEAFLPLMYDIGQSPEVVKLAIPYLKINGYSLIPFMLFFSLRGLSEGLSETRPPMIAMLFGNVINVLLNYMLIYGNWGAPQMGVEGAAIGTFVARCSMFFLLTLLLWKWKKVSASGMRIWEYVVQLDPWNYSSAVFKKILNIGMPTALQMLFEIAAFAGAGLLMGVIGPNEQAAHQITINVISATFMICVGLSIASTIRVGNHLGRQELKRLRPVGVSAILQAVLFMVISGIFMFIFRFWIPTLYIDDAAVIEIAATLFLVATLFQISDGIQVAAIGALRGLQDVIYPTWVTFVAYLCIGLPFSYVAAFHFGMGYIGIWLGLFIGLSLSAWLNTRRFIHLTKRMEAGS